MVRVSAPATPVMISALVPPGVLPSVVTVSVALEPAGFGVNSALAPEGSPLTLSATLDEKPLIGLIAIE